MTDAHLQDVRILPEGPDAMGVTQPYAAFVPKQATSTRLEESIRSRIRLYELSPKPLTTEQVAVLAELNSLLRDTQE